jgi:hypothetical protein
MNNRRRLEHQFEEDVIPIKMSTSKVSNSPRNIIEKDLEMTPEWGWIGEICKKKMPPVK